MDIDLLSRMVKDLIMGNDAVTLPGVGTFVADLMPSTFSDKGYTINPPYRRLYFTPKIGSDTLLVDLYAGSNGISAEESAMILGDFLSQMKEVLKVRKTIVFPGLGRLRATRENNFFFVADEDLDIYPEGLALEPVSLKNHIETKAEVRQAVESLAGLMAGPAPVQKEDQPSEVSPGESEVTEAIAAAEPVDEPVAEEPVTEEPVAEEPVAEEPAAEVFEEPAPVEESVVEEYADDEELNYVYNDFKKNCKFLVEIDRRGSHDAVFYRDDNKDFHKFVEDVTGYIKASGSCSDICNLSDACQLSSVNLSSGYYHEHTLEEKIVVEETLHTKDMVIKLIEEACKDETPTYIFTEKKWSNVYNYSSSTSHPICKNCIS